MTLLAMFDLADGGCRTCGFPMVARRPWETPRLYCSYWCELVDNGPDFYTLEAITPWLESNRNRKRT